MLLNCVPTHLPASALSAGTRLVRLPFDAIGLHYAACVQAGLIRRSMLESRDFLQMLASMEQLTLGPWARRN